MVYHGFDRSGVVGLFAQHFELFEEIGSDFVVVANVIFYEEFRPVFRIKARFVFVDRSDTVNLIHIVGVHIVLQVLV